MDMGAGSMSIWSWLHIDMELAPYQFEAGSISIWSWLHIDMELALYRYGAGSVSIWSWLHMDGADSIWMELAPYRYWLLTSVSWLLTSGAGWLCTPTRTYGYS